MKRRFSTIALVLPAALLAGDAIAVQAPPYLDERPLETAQGRGRLSTPTAWAAPAARQAAWRAFTARHGQWSAVWDRDRGVPLRVYGEGIPAPGASHDPAAAEAAARALLAEQLELIAPESKLDNWTLVSNVVHGRDARLRTVGFTQTHAGLPVLGGQVSFLFKRDRMIVMSSSAMPGVGVSVPARPVDVTKASQVASAWIDQAYGARPEVLGERGLAVLPIIRERRDGIVPLEYRVVRTVVVDLAEPRAKWEVYVDAATGQAVARTQLLRFGEGTVRYDAPIRWPGGGRQNYPAPQASVTVDGQAASTSQSGLVSFTGNGPASVVARVTGAVARVTTSGGGGSATQTLSLADGGDAVWSAANQETVDAQLSGYIHANLAKQFAKAELAPDMPWLDQQIRVAVNESGQCNAYSNGDDIHFFMSSSQCENTGRLADVIYHEFGHSLHAHAIVQGAGAFDSAMSEGISDYLAATIVDDPGMGRGFFRSSTALRDLDPNNYEYRWPRDVEGDPHATGLIIGGALWDARKALITQYGDQLGRQMADDWFFAVISRASEIPTAYAEVLAYDDDDGNLANGTPNKCLIDATFAPHGIIDPMMALGIGVPVRDDFQVSVDVVAPIGGCPAAQIRTVEVLWRLRDDVISQRVELTRTDDTYAGYIPEQAEGSLVQYKVNVILDDGTSYSYPDNAADPMYEFYVGPLIPVYCTDFETDPFAEGWSHAAQTSDEWEWGTPEGNSSNGDPAAAHSGTGVVGMDLGIGGRDGLYRSNASTTLTSPVIDVTGRSGVRLQYWRWLGVEDGYYDQATIRADGQQVWSNFRSSNQNASTQHRDREWRFHDIDLTAAAADGSVQITFGLESDEGLEFGGWTLDDFCIMARGEGGVCGDGAVQAGEQCDDGNLVDGDGCSAACVTEDIAEPGGCCSTGTGPTGPLALGLLTALGLLGRRRRRRG